MDRRSRYLARPHWRWAPIGIDTDGQIVERFPAHITSLPPTPEGMHTQLRCERTLGQIIYSTSSDLLAGALPASRH